MPAIDSRPRTIGDLLRRKYKLDYYQREYSWQTQHVTELLDDLTGKFLESYTRDEEPIYVLDYGHYFLGSIIISDLDNQRFIIDGQQRLTTLTLLLIKLYHLLKDENQKNQVATLIFSRSVIEGMSFNLDISERRQVMEKLYYTGKASEADIESESINNIVNRYNDIENHFELPKQALPYFADWLMEKVYLVEITADDDREAYTIFETMNDRGLSLTSADMLRGYLLSNIEDTQHRTTASEVWRKQIQSLKNIGREEESDAIKAWLRSQYAKSMRDFERIGSEFHRWVRDRKSTLNLTSGSKFANFIKLDFKFYTTWYHRLRNAANSLSEALKHGLECVYYNEQHNFTLQYPVLLAALCVGDTPTKITKKIQIVAAYLDIFIHRYIWNFLSVTQRNMVNPMFAVMRDIRGKSIDELANILHTKLNNDPLDSSSNAQLYLFGDSLTGHETSVFGAEGFRLHGGNRQKIRLILARLTDYLETETYQGKSQYDEYIQTGNNGYEVEHIWADHPDNYRDEFPQVIDFQEYRNRIGGLLLLPTESNRRYSDSHYSEKREHYANENLLARSLHEITYKRKSEFQQFIERSELPFQPHSEFKRADLDKRQQLYQLLAERIWNPERLRVVDDSESGIAAIQLENPYENHGIEEDNVEYLDLENKDKSDDTEEPSAIELLIMNEVRESYKTKSDTTIRGLCARVAELLNLIEKKGWSELTFKPRKLYCAFYSGSNPLFGAFLFADPRFVIWMDAEDVEKLKSFCEFRYIPSRRQAIYPEGTTIEEIWSTLEYVYMS